MMGIIHGPGKPAARTRMRQLVWLQIFALLFGQCSTVLANPLDGTVVSGSATIHQHGFTTHIHQSSNRAIINWQGFSIAPGELTQFNQPGSSAAILNRVTGSQMSQLMGTLQANGNVYLINPNGILIGQGATINVGGFVASTLDVTNSQFMKGGDLTFSGNSQASVINRGNVTALQGDIYLIGAHVENHGVLRSVNGTVGLAAGQEVKLVDSSHQQLVVRATDRSIGGAGVVNTGIIDAVQAELAANGGNVYALAINNRGVVRANGSVTRNGRVYLTAPGGKIANSGDLIAKNTDGSGGEVKINSATGATGGLPTSASGVTNLSGRIDVSGVTGGRVEVLGDEVNLTGATIDAFGTADGGVVLIGGDYQGNNPAIINARTSTVDASSTINVGSTLSGNGGQVIVWSDDTTTFGGTITARGGSLGGNGGFAEVSGKQTLNYTGLADLSAPLGQGGALLLDPVDFTFDGTNVPGIVGTLNGGASVVVATDGGTGGNGDVFINEAILYDSTAFFGILAHGDILANASVQNNGSGEVALVAGWDGLTEAPGGSGINSPAAFDINNIFNTPGSFGINNGSVFIGNGMQTSGIAVGSRFGATNVAAHDLNLRGSDGTNNAFAQLGFRDTGGAIASIDGPIDIALTGDLTATAGIGRFGSYVQVGHGGRFSGGDFRGAITIAQANDIRFQAGTSSGTYAQLGHGGQFAFGNQRGNITITQANNLNFRAGNGFAAYAQLGHGGTFVFGDQTGDITIIRANDVNFLGGGEFGAYAQFGHGGVGVNGDQSGNINILHANNLIFLGNHGENTYAQLGHGGTALPFEEEEGSQSFGQVSLANQTGNITIARAKELFFGGGSGDNSYAQLGHGGFNTIGNQTGDISVRLVGSNLRLIGALASFGGTTPNSYAQIGHGAAAGNATGIRTGNINVIIDGSAGLFGDSALSPALLGHATNTPSGIIGNLVLAIDQINPVADNGGRLFMNQYSAIDMGGAPNQVRIFGTRRLGNVLADGAVINGIIVDSSLPPGTITGNRFNPNVEFTNWDHEQWGPVPDQYTLAQPGPFTAPFTFFYLGRPLPPMPPIVNPPQFTLFSVPYDEFIRAQHFAETVFLMFPNGPYGMYYDEWPQRPLEDEKTGATSADIYNP